MASELPMLGSFLTAGRRPSIARLFLLVSLGRFALVPVLADGCFVFKWNKAIDINEPTQKAIIVHDAGREDLLLQVKYEGPLEEFGWLIPVPSLPKVEKGSMEPFYELSQLTQRQFGGGTKGHATLGVANDGVGESVKVIETKTVGAYEISVLTAKDADSLARWLRVHDYSLPEGKSEIVDDYVRRGWYFIAAKIELNKGVAFKTTSTTSPGDSDAPTKARKALQKKLASGELHPLLISFDTPKCVFPLKISAMNEKPSEISLYVLSQEPLLEKFIFGKACDNLRQSHSEWTKQTPERSRSRVTSYQNMRSMQLALMMYNQNSTNRVAPGRGSPRNWSTEDIAALAKESTPPIPDGNLGEAFYASPEELLHQMRLESGKIPKCAKVLTRLKERDWHLTKLVWTFSPAEMHDLELEPAIPVLSRVLPDAIGCAAAQFLAQLGGDAMSRVFVACESTNSTERLNAVIGLERASKAMPTDVFLTLLKDTSPQVRLYAARSGPTKWNQRSANALIQLLRDPHLEIRQEATGCLSNRENTNRTPVYLALLNDPNPNVRLHSLAVASWMNRYAPSEEVIREALRLLRDPSEDVQSSALHTLARQDRTKVPKADLLPLLNSSRSDTVLVAANLLRWGGRVRHPGDSAQPDEPFTSVEAAPLMTNRFGNARLHGLLVMQANADATAVELTLPLLRDSNSVIRSRACVVLQAISAQNFSDDDPTKWEAWWAANKATFSPRKPQQ
jgi:HEAT repeat protein